MFKNKDLKSYYIKAVLFSIIAVLISFVFVILATRPAFFDFLDLSKTGQIGDSIGGITAPIIGIFAASLTFLAFYVQFKANEKHFNLFEKQEIEKNRNIFIENIKWLISQNREIINNISIKEFKGTKCLSLMCRELKFSYLITKKFYNNSLPNKDILNISYVIFYIGIGPSSNLLINDILSNYEKINKLLGDFSFFKNELKRNVLRGNPKISSTLKSDDIHYLKLGYTPFDGHQTRLGHYFRNLFHILSQVSNQDPTILNKTQKYELIKFLRTQFSSYEQILIYFNSLSVFGLPQKKYINEFKLIKNIPLPYIDYAENIKNFYNSFEFEWEEIKKRRLS